MGITRRKLLLALVPFSVLALLALFFSLEEIKEPKSSLPTENHIHVHEHLQIAHSTCQETLYPELCVSTLATFPDLRQRTLPEIISGLVNSTVFEVRDSSRNCTGIRKKLPNLDPLDSRALDDCLELFDDTVAQLRTAFSHLSSNKSAFQHYMDLQTLFSAAMTNQYTCLDGFAFSKKKFIRKLFEGRLQKISHHVSNSLAMLKKLKKYEKKTSSSETEFFPGEEFGTTVRKEDNGFPTWLKKKDRALLQTAVNQIKFDLIVAKDGSGNFTTIGEALRVAPNSSTTRFVIYIKAGAYYEYLGLERRQTNIMFVGDGIGKTLIKGNRSVGGNFTTFGSSTVGTSILPSSINYLFRYFENIKVTKNYYK